MILVTDNESKSGICVYHNTKFLVFIFNSYGRYVKTVTAIWKVEPEMLHLSPRGKLTMILRQQIPKSFDDMFIVIPEFPDALNMPVCYMSDLFTCLVQ